MSRKRKFNGKLYSLKSVYLPSDKRMGEREVDRLRGNGHNARLIKTETGYELWVRWKK